MNVCIWLVVILNFQDMMSYLEINALCSFYGQCPSNSGNVLFLRIFRMRSFSTGYIHQHATHIELRQRINSKTAYSTIKVLPVKVYT